MVENLGTLLSTKNTPTFFFSLLRRTGLVLRTPEEYPIQSFRLLQPKNPTLIQPHDETFTRQKRSRPSFGSYFSQFAEGLHFLVFSRSFERERDTGSIIRRVLPSFHSTHQLAVQKVHRRATLLLPLFSLCRRVRPSLLLELEKLGPTRKPPIYRICDLERSPLSSSHLRVNRLISHALRGQATPPRWSFFVCSRAPTQTRPLSLPLLQQRAYLQFHTLWLEEWVSFFLFSFHLLLDSRTYRGKLIQAFFSRDAHSNVGRAVPADLALFCDRQELRTHTLFDPGRQLLKLAHYAIRGPFFSLQNFPPPTTTSPRTLIFARLVNSRGRYSYKPKKTS